MLGAMRIAKCNGLSVTFCVQSLLTLAAKTIYKVVYAGFHIVILCGHNAITGTDAVSTVDRHCSRPSSAKYHIYGHGDHN